MNMGAQTLRNPFDFPALLSGNFGELRSNHFHSGIDFKTQGEEGKAIHAVQDGYISRIFVSPWGYGNALYLVHPDHTMTVYGHLQRFNDSIAYYVKEQQYEQEQFRVDLALTPEQFPVKQGDIIGYSGNSGSSGGPHLHFEVRDTTDEPMDPLPFFETLIKDSRPPTAQAVMIYPVEGQGSVNNSSQRLRLQAVNAQGRQTVKGKIEAWGKIAFGINVDDFMDQTTNVYGVKELTMSVDGVEMFNSYLDRFSFDETRYLNTFVDYETWCGMRSFFTKTFVSPGNRLRFITSKNRGLVTINEKRPYRIDFRLADAFGNTGELSLEVIGKEQIILPPDTAGATLFYWNVENRFGAKGIRLSVPKGSLYENLYFRHKTMEDTTLFSAIHQLHDKPVALHKPANLSLFLAQDTLPEKRQYGIISINRKKYTWIGGTYRDGWMDAEIRELGNYAVAQDTIPPKIMPVDSVHWMTDQKIAFRLTDDLSGISAYRGEIDGNYALFEMDGKKSLIWYIFDNKRLMRGEHTLILVVTDHCGNRSEYKTKFRQ
jgi:hypothetical protein